MRKGKNKIFGIFVLMLLIITSTLPLMSTEKIIYQEKNEDNKKNTYDLEFSIDLDDLIITDNLDMFIENSNNKESFNSVYHIYEGVTWRLYVTAHWNPPQPSRPICLWADYSTMPEGSILTPECNCGEGEVTSTFEWTPPVGSSGEYLIIFIAGESCGNPETYKYVNVYVHPYYPEPVKSFTLYAETFYDIPFTVTSDPENTVCMWSDLETLPEGALFDDCHCDQGEVTSEFIWTPSVEQIGSHIFTILVGSDCGYYDIPIPIEFIVITFQQIPPDIDIIRPRDKTISSNSDVTLTGFITDDTGIVTLSSIHEWIDGEALTSGTIDPAETYYPFEWDFTLREGWNRITISASDGQDLTGEDSVTLYYDSTPPELELISPTNSIYFKDNDLFSFPYPLAIGSITIEVDASDDLSGVEKVEFYIDDEIQAGDCTEPYSWKWGGTYFGSHTITIRAYDEVGNYNEIEKEITILNWNGETTKIPNPVITNLKNDQSIGGLVRINVKEANDAEDIVKTKFSYFDGDKWTEIGTDDGLVTDIDKYRGEWFVWWETNDIPSGTYKVRAEMENLDSYKGYEEITLNLKKQPVISVEIIDYNPETKTTIFDASKSYDPDGRIDEYIWTFYTYPNIDRDTGETVEFVSPENYDNYTFSLEIVDSQGISTSELFFNVEETQPERKFAIEVQEIDNLTENLTAILNEKQDILNGMNPGDDGYTELESSLRNLGYAIEYLEWAKNWLSRAKWWQAQGNQENEYERIEWAKERIRWVLEELKDKVIPHMEDASEHINNLEDNINKLKEKYIRAVCLDAKVWIISEIGPTTHGAYVPVPDDIWICDDTSYYNSSNQSIHIKKDHVDYKDIILHEYDHHFMFKKNNKTNYPGGDHWIAAELKDTRPKPGLPPRSEDVARQLAWSEGWASFSACAKTGSSTFTGSNYEWDLEKDEIETGGNTIDIPEPSLGPPYYDPTTQDDDCEGCIAGILWDLFDDTPNERNSANDKVDEVSLSFKTIVAAMNIAGGSADQGDIHDFYDRLEDVLGEDQWRDLKDKIDTIFQNHGVNP